MILEAIAAEIAHLRSDHKEIDEIRIHPDGWVELQKEYGTFYAGHRDGNTFMGWRVVLDRNLPRPFEVIIRSPFGPPPVEHLVQITLNVDGISYTHDMKITNPDFAIPPDFILHEGLARIRQKVFTETLDTIEIRYPNGWRQALKEAIGRRFPSFTRRFPVRYITQTMVAKVYYPRISLPNQGGRVVLEKISD